MKKCYSNDTNLLLTKLLSLKNKHLTHCQVIMGKNLFQTVAQHQRNSKLS